MMETPRYTIMSVEEPDDDDEEAHKAWRERFRQGEIVAVPGAEEGSQFGVVRASTGAERLIYQLKQLEALRAPIPEDQIEKLPKPMWGGAWDDLRGARCEECHGYHVLQNAIHLDYFGHAQVTQRLLEVDPFWNWEPVAVDQDGFPKLDQRGGLWINLTVAGVTRKGYGDAVGKKQGTTTSMKEIIGDAIRNGAMRFGVALELWSKIDRQEGKNPGDGETSQRNNRGQDRDSTASRGNAVSGGGEGNSRPNGEAPATQRAPNHDALEDLGAVCDDEGIPRNEIRGLWVGWLLTQPDRPQIDIMHSHPDHINAFARFLIEQAVAAGEPAGPPAETPDAQGVRAGGDGGSYPPEQKPAGDEPGAVGGDVGRVQEVVGAENSGDDGVAETSVAESGETEPSDPGEALQSDDGPLF